MAILRGRERELMEANNTGGGRPVRHKIPLGTLIFLVYIIIMVVLRDI